MPPKLVPVYFQRPDDPEFVKQCDHITDLLSSTAELSSPIKLGMRIPDDADAVIFPQMLGDAFRHLDDFKQIHIPILVITSEFGTVSMWDWEINTYLRSHEISVLAPYNLDHTKKICNIIGLKKKLRRSKFIVYQDNPGEGFQAEIFKRFYWWEQECIDSLTSKFGFSLIKKSFRELAGSAKSISDDSALREWKAIKDRIPTINLTDQSILSSIKLYMTLRQELDNDPAIVSMGINCLNESSYSDTTPCLSWNLLFEDRRITWGCEADLVSMVTEYLVHKCLSVPFMMTNLYPFLMGMAALKHEKIKGFPEVMDHPENHILMAHCGYLGVVPQSFSTEWRLNEKVLAIVDNNANAIDARLPVGPVTLVKLPPPHSTGYPWLKAN